MPGVAPAGLGAFRSQHTWEQRYPRCGATPRRQLLKDARKTLVAQTQAHRPWRRLAAALPADGVLAPGAHDLAIALASQGLTGVAQDLLDAGHEGAGVLDQLATPLDLAAGPHGLEMLRMRHRSRLPLR